MRKEYILFILLAVVLFLAAAWIIPLETARETLPMVINVTESSNPQLGFSVSPKGLTVLDFGTTFPGSTVIKTMNLSRGNQPPVLVSLSSEGIMGPWVELSHREFLLKEPVQLKVSVRVPDAATDGRYTGNLVIVYKKTLFSLFMA
jgi:hypothetical protein